MPYDMGIIYHAKLKEVRETIEKLGMLSFDMTEVKEMVNTIEKEIEQKVKKELWHFLKRNFNNFLIRFSKRRL